MVVHEIVIAKGALYTKADVELMQGMIDRSVPLHPF
jgi:hypothetical protein